LLDDDQFPLRAQYSLQVPAEREYVNFRRRVVTSRDTTVMLDLTLPVMQLTPFPGHISKLRALRHLEQDSYDEFAASVSAMLAGWGIFHFLIPGDPSMAHWEQPYGFLNETGYVTDLYGLQGEKTGYAQELQRLSVLLPLEQRTRVADLLWGFGDHGPGGLGTHLSAVELTLGHIQIGEQGYGFARGSNFRTFCASCLWLSLYFYVMEVTNTEPGMGSLIPLAPWQPCRLGTSELFPVRHDLLGSSGQTVPMARAAHPGGDMNTQIMGFKHNRRDIVHGSCRESLQRGLQRLGMERLQIQSSGRVHEAPPLPPALPELLPMHDISERISWGTNLEMLIAIKQYHVGPGLERYEDKIALTREFQRRGIRMPKLYYASYDASFDVRPIIHQLSSEGRAYVAKASHMCCSMGVFVMENGIDHVSGTAKTPDEIQEQLQDTFARPFTEITPRCGDWGTVEAGRNPGILVEELIQPSFSVQPLLDRLGGGSWVSPDILACHLVWGTIFYCIWDINIRIQSGEMHNEQLGTLFRDGSCLGCRLPPPFGSRSGWSAAVSLLEGLLPHTDYLRISVFIQDNKPVINEIEYTTGGLETVPLPIAREWSLRWLEGYSLYHS